MIPTHHTLTFISHMNDSYTSYLFSSICVLLQTIDEVVILYSFTFSFFHIPQPKLSSTIIGRHHPPPYPIHFYYLNLYYHSFSRDTNLTDICQSKKYQYLLEALSFFSSCRLQGFIV